MSKFGVSTSMITIAITVLLWNGGLAFFQAPNNAFIMSLASLRCQIEVLILTKRLFSNSTTSMLKNLLQPHSMLKGSEGLII